MIKRMNNNNKMMILKMSTMVMMMMMMMMTTWRISSIPPLSSSRSAGARVVSVSPSVFLIFNFSMRIIIFWWFLSVYFGIFWVYDPTTKMRNSYSSLYITKNPDCVISEMKRASADPLVSKRSDFLGLFRLSNIIDFWISDFWSYRRSAGVKKTGFWISAWATRPDHSKGAKDQKVGVRT